MLPFGAHGAQDDLTTPLIFSQYQQVICSH
jgi:hypothetical protein